MCAVPLVTQDSNHTLNDTRLNSLLQPPPLGLDLSAQGNDVAPRIPAVQDHGKEEKTVVGEDERAWTTVVGSLFIQVAEEEPEGWWLNRHSRSWKRKLRRNKDPLNT